MTETTTYRTRGGLSVQRTVVPAHASLEIPALVEALGDEDEGVRRRAAVALGEIGPEAAPALAALRELRNEGGDVVREAAARAVRDIKRADGPAKAAGGGYLPRRPAILWGGRWRARPSTPPGPRA